MRVHFWVPSDLCPWQHPRGPDPALPKAAEADSNRAQLLLLVTAVSLTLENHSLPDRPGASQGLRAGWMLPRQGARGARRRETLAAGSLTGCSHFRGALSRTEFLPVWHT